MESLTVKDWVSLVEAVDAWEKLPKYQAMADSMLRGSDLVKSCCSLEALENGLVILEQELKTKTSPESLKVRGERAVLLKAKLIHLRDSAVADEMVEARGHKPSEETNSLPQALQV